jgi:hypothetical protein
MQHLKTAKGRFGNVLKFYRPEAAENSILVHDTSAEMSRLYTLGKVQELNGFEPTLITSTKQVMDAWTSGEIHF